MVALDSLRMWEFGAKWSH